MITHKKRRKNWSYVQRC